MRLEAEGQAWTLPAARAALIAADTPILVTLTARVTANSALFSQTFVAAPRHPLSVFEVTPLVRELLRECRAYTSPTEPLDEYATPLFRALATVCWRQAQSPSPAVMPVAKSEALARVLQLTESEMAAPPSFEQLAERVGLASRSLARRFQEELGMTWREALRRMRMIRAIERLVDSEASASITEIAFDVGYSSLSAFNTAFREFAGMTPSDYRRSFVP
jgi:AraC-like DNA-binding protein